jgi:hypothetical protein
MRRHHFQAWKNSLELPRTFREGKIDAVGVDGRSEQGCLLHRSYCEVEA